MGYYDEDTGEYIGYDPIEAHDRRVFEETYFKKFVPTTEKLLEQLYYRGMVDESKKYIPEPECNKDDFLSQYMHGLEKMMYNSVGDLRKSMELIAEDIVKNKNKKRLIHTTREHIVREGTHTHILYEYDDENVLKVLGVFWDEHLANKIMEYLNE